MLFCHQFGDILKSYIGGDPKHGFNRTAQWGSVYLLREYRLKETSRVRTATGRYHDMDGHAAFLHDKTTAEGTYSAAYEQGDAQLMAVAIRCWGWKHGFKGDRTVDMSQVMSAAYSNTAATIHESEEWKPRLLTSSPQDTVDHFRSVLESHYSELDESSPICC